MGGRKSTTLFLVGGHLMEQANTESTHQTTSPPSTPCTRQNAYTSCTTNHPFHTSNTSRVSPVHTSPPLLNAPTSLGSPSTFGLKTNMKWYYTIAGSHVHVRVFMNGASCGQLCFRMEEFAQITELTTIQLAERSEFRRNQTTYINETK